MPDRTRNASAAGRAEGAPRHYLMCPPIYFDVVYSINPWMDTTKPVDTALAAWMRATSHPFISFSTCAACKG